MPDEFLFSHEKLDVYCEAIEFASWLSCLFSESSKIGDVKDHLDRASTSIALNIAEGNEKLTAKDRCRFSILPLGHRWNVPPGWIFLWPVKSLLIMRFGLAKNVYTESFRCLSGRSSAIRQGDAMGEPSP